MAGVLGYGEPTDWGSEGFPEMDTGGLDWGNWAQKQVQDLMGTYLALKVSDMRAGTSASVQDRSNTPEGQRAGGMSAAVAGVPAWVWLAGGGLLLVLMLKK